MIVVKLFSHLRSDKRENEIEIKDGDEIGRLLDDIVRERPSLREKIFNSRGELKDSINVFINGKNVNNLDGLKTKAKDDDVISLFPPLGGG